MAERPRRESKLRGMHPAERGHAEDDVVLRPAVEVVAPRTEKASTTGYPARPAVEPERPKPVPRREKKVINPTFSSRISPETIKRLKVFAVLNDMDVQDLTELALDEWLTQHGG